MYVRMCMCSACVLTAFLFLLSPPSFVGAIIAELYHHVHNKIEVACACVCLCTVCCFVAASHNETLHAYVRTQTRTTHTLTRSLVIASPTELSR